MDGFFQLNACFSENRPETQAGRRHVSVNITLIIRQYLAGSGINMGRTARRQGGKEQSLSGLFRAKNRHMTEAELRKMSRGELLQMLVLQSEETAHLKKRISELEAEAEKREILVNRAGSIAEAALRLNGVFEAADRAVEQYKQNTYRLSRDQEAVLKARRAEVEQKAMELMRKARIEADRSKAEADRYWQELSRKLEIFYNEHKGLRELMAVLMDRTNGTGNL